MNYPVITQWIKDYGKYQNWLRENDKKIGVSNLLALLEKYQSDYFRVQIIKTIRVQQWLDSSSTIKSSLKDLITYVDLNQKDKKASLEFLRIRSSELSDQLMSSGYLAERDTFAFRKVSVWSAKQLDELCKLYEQIAVHSEAQ